MLPVNVLALMFFHPGIQIENHLMSTPYLNNALPRGHIIDALTINVCIDCFYFSSCKTDSFCRMLV